MQIFPVRCTLSYLAPFGVWTCTWTSAFYMTHWAKLQRPVIRIVAFLKKSKGKNSVSPCRGLWSGSRELSETELVRVCISFLPLFPPFCAHLCLSSISTPLLFSLLFSPNSPDSFHSLHVTRVSGATLKGGSLDYRILTTPVQRKNLCWLQSSTHTGLEVHRWSFTWGSGWKGMGSCDVW